MRKFLSTIIALGTAVSAIAEGYQVNSLSARQEGMGHVGVAMELGAESMFFNPGAMAFSDKTFELSGALSAIIPSATATHNGIDYDTDNKVSTPFNISASFKVYDNLYAGLSLYTPYGSAINWGENWPGAVLNQSVEIKSFNLQPTLSWRVLPNLSVGAGMMIGWGSVDLNKGLVSASSLNTLLGALQMPPAMMFDGITPASVNLKGSSKLALGFNVGAMWKVDSRWSIGASFRSRMILTVDKGDAVVTYANETARKLLGTYLDNLNTTNFSASLPCPYIFTAGISYKPIDGLIVAFDAQLNGWGTYKTLDIAFDNLPAYDQHLTKDYHNAMTYHLGAQYALTPRMDIRAGLMIDTTPVNNDYYNPETPGQTRIEPSVGFSFRPVRQLSIDVAMMYVHGCGAKNARGEYEDFIAKNYPQLGLPVTGTFTADYKLHAFSPAIGLTYSF